MSGTPDCPPKLYAFAYRDADGVKIEAYATAEEATYTKKQFNTYAEDGRSAPAYGFVYLGPDLVLAKIAAAVKAERERIAGLVSAAIDDVRLNGDSFDVGSALFVLRHVTADLGLDRPTEASDP